MTKTEEDDEMVPIVPFVPFRCPRCGRHKPITRKVWGRKRYHKCQHCGCLYNSWELTAEDVPNWTPPKE